MRRRFGKVFFCVILCFTLISSVCFGVSAAGCEFALSDVQVKNGRIFTASLKCESDREISAFIAEVAYDEDALEYRSASTTDKSAQCSVNANESGHLRLVYLCEEGADCKGNLPLIELKFKALKNGDYPLSISVSQVVDSASLDVEVNKSEGALVQVGAITAAHNSVQREDNAKTKNTEKASGTIEEESTGSGNDNGDVTGYTGVDGAEHDVILIVASVMAVLTLLCLVGFCAYKYGIKVAIKKKEQVLLENFTKKKDK